MNRRAGERIAGPLRRSRRRGARAASAGVVALAALLALTACTGSGGSDGGSPAARVTTVTKTVVPSTPPAPPPTTPRAAPAAKITTSLGPGKAVNPATPITVQVTGGTLTSVHLINPKEDRTVRGTLSADKHTWTSTEALGYSKSYRLSAHAVNADGTPATDTTTFSTLTPGNMTMPYFDRIGGYAMKDGATYGVAFVPMVYFDEHIENKAAAEKALHVTTSPHVNGSWYWVTLPNGSGAYWRPKQFYQPGTKVTISADVYGVEVGPGLYGQSDKKISFTIGRYQKTVADDTRTGPGRIKVYNGAGHVIRTMDTSMGKHGGTHYNGKYINYYTLDGTYTVIHFENPAIMSSESYGLPADAPGGYAPEKIPWSTKISTGGIYLHELTNTVGAQEQGIDVSHGCLNLNHDNAKWFFKHSLIGDPVIVKGHKHAPKIQLWQGGEWSVPWSEWVAGSALH